MKVEELIIDGFKSYATRTVISGWDHQFNAITGLNGSGKSNILDAICFVLGIASMSTVRAQNLQDLIYKRGQAGVTKASVTIVFNNNEVAKSPIGFENCATISVTRQIILGGSSKYLINGHRAQQQTVLNLFQSVQLNINNPNFLIMQGKITKVLNMKPLEILALIEEAAGTRTFEERKDKAQKTMAKKEAKLSEIRGLLREEIEPKLEKLRNEKRAFVEFQQTQIDLERLSRIVAAHDYLRLSKSFTRHSNSLSQHESRLADLGFEIERLSIEIENLNADLAQVRAQRELELTAEGSIKELERREQELLNAVTRASTARDIKRDNLRDEQQKLENTRAAVAEITAALAANKDSYAAHEAEYTTAQADLARLKEEHNKKEELLSTLLTGVSSTGSSAGGYATQLNEAKARVNESASVIERLELRIEHLREQLRTDAPKLAKARSDNEQLLTNIARYKEEIDAREAKIREMGVSREGLNELLRREQVLAAEEARLVNERRQIEREVGNIGFQYSRPHENFNDDAVRGVVAQLFQVRENEGQAHGSSLALQVCAGSRLYNVVVDTSEVATQLLERGQLKRRVTIIPLDKISARRVDSKVVEHAHSMAPGKVELALDMIDFEGELLKAMQYIFGSTFVCRDPDTAKQVTFAPQIRTRSITWDGDVYDPEGNLSGGSRRGGTATLAKIQAFNRLGAELTRVQAELGEVRASLSHMSEAMQRTQLLQTEVDLKKYECGLLEKKLEGNLTLRTCEQNERQIKELEAEVAEATRQREEHERELERITRDMQEFNRDKGSKLKAMQAEVAELKAGVSEKLAAVALLADGFQQMQIDSEQQRAELGTLEESIKALTGLIAEMERETAALDAEFEGASAQLVQVRAELEDERANLVSMDDEISALVQAVADKSALVQERKLEVQRLNHEHEKLEGITGGLKSQLDAIIHEHEWVTDTNVVEGLVQQYQHVNLEECGGQLAALQEKFEGMKRKVNVNIMSMIDNVEKKEALLKHMVRTIEKDKSKIVNTIDKLNGYKRDTLNTTYQKVSEDFGQIFADLLPGSYAKLVPVDMMDVTKGLEVKVKLGEVWKESLVELSGGQRSLIALSLIMALLQFKPAPMYILDEVDAALDLSHTQNIGHLIKTRFKGSQFIVVSLKEGMFTNANRVFRTRFQNGTSVVLVM